jgi:hypothetical protein
MSGHSSFERDAAKAWREPDRGARLARARRASRGIACLVVTTVVAGMSLHVLLAWWGGAVG